MFILYTLKNPDICTDEEKVYELPDGSTEDYINMIGDELVEDKNTSEGIEVGEDDGSGVEVEGYYFTYKILKGTKAEVEEGYGIIYQV